MTSSAISIRATHVNLQESSNADPRVQHPKSQAPDGNINIIQRSNPHGIDPLDCLTFHLIPCLLVHLIPHHCERRNPKPQTLHSKLHSHCPSHVEIFVPYISWEKTLNP